MLQKKCIGKVRSLLADARPWAAINLTENESVCEAALDVARRAHLFFINFLRDEDFRLNIVI